MSRSPSKFSVRDDAIKQKKDGNQYQQDSAYSPPVRRHAQKGTTASGGGQQGIPSAQSAETRDDSSNDGSSVTSFHRCPPSEGKRRIGISKSLYDGICYAEPPAK